MGNVNGRIKYSEISAARVADNKSVVVSRCSLGGYTISQRMEMIEDGDLKTVFLKGAFRIKNLDGLFEIRDALNLAIEKERQREIERSQMTITMPDETTTYLVNDKEIDWD